MPGRCMSPKYVLLGLHFFRLAGVGCVVGPPYAYETAFRTASPNLTRVDRLISLAHACNSSVMARRGVAGLFSRSRGATRPPTCSFTAPGICSWRIFGGKYALTSAIRTRCSIVAKNVLPVLLSPIRDIETTEFEFRSSDGTDVDHLNGYRHMSILPLARRAQPTATISAAVTIWLAVSGGGGGLLGRRCGCGWRRRSGGLMRWRRSRGLGARQGC